MGRGLPEYEALVESGQITLALTLLRAFGSPGAQLKRTLSAEYALISVPDSANLLRNGQRYSAPLQATICAKRPVKPSQSYLTIDGEGLTVDQQTAGVVQVAGKQPINHIRIEFLSIQNSDVGGSGIVIR